MDQYFYQSKLFKIIIVVFVVISIIYFLNRESTSTCPLLKTNENFNPIPFSGKHEKRLIPIRFIKLFTDKNLSDNILNKMYSDAYDSTPDYDINNRIIKYCQGRGKDCILLMAETNDANDLYFYINPCNYWKIYWTKYNWTNPELRGMVCEQLMANEFYKKLLNLYPYPQDSTSTSLISYLGEN